VISAAANCALLSQLGGLGARVGCLEWHSYRPWESVTFAGTRHELRYTFYGAESADWAEQFIASLPGHAFKIPDQLVADATVTQVDHLMEPLVISVTCQLLLLEEG